MSGNPTYSIQKRSTQPSFTINHEDSDSANEQGLSRNDNRFSVSSDAYPLDPKTSKDTNDVNLDSDEELHFDKEALATHSDRESLNYIKRQNKLAKDGPNPCDTIFELLEDENEMEILDFLRTHFVDLTKLRDARGYSVLHIVAYKGLESM